MLMLITCDPVLCVCQGGSSTGLRWIHGQHHPLAAAVRRLPVLPARERPVGAQPVRRLPGGGRRPGHGGARQTRKAAPHTEDRSEVLVFDRLTAACLPPLLQVMTLLSSDMSVAVFNSIPGQGVVYSVVVRDPVLNTSASYVPVHTYACSFASTLDGCRTLGERALTLGSKFKEPTRSQRHRRK